MGGVKSAGVSQSVRETGRDESQSVPSPANLFKTRDFVSSQFLRDLSQVVRLENWGFLGLQPVPRYTNRRFPVTKNFYSRTNHTQDFNN